MSRALRNIARRKARVALAVVAIGVAVAIMVSIPAGLSANQAAMEAMNERLNVDYSEMTAEIENTSSLVQVGNSGGTGQSTQMGQRGEMGGTTSSNSTINSTVIADITALDGVEAVIPYVIQTEGLPEPGTFTPGSFSAGDRNGTRPDFGAMTSSMYTVRGVSLDAQYAGYDLLPTVISGNTLVEGETGYVLLSENLTEYFDTSLGGTITIDNTAFTVAGIYSSDTSNRTVYMSLEDAQSLYSLNDTVTYLDVYATDADMAEEVATIIEAAYSDLPVTTMSDRLAQLTAAQETTAQSLASANTTLSQTEAAGQQEMIIAIAAAAAVILFTMLYTVKERTREIGVLKTLGFSKRAVILQFMLEGILICAIAGVVGLVLGWTGSSFLASVLLPSTTGTTGGAPGETTTALTSLSIQPDLLTMVLVFGLVLLIGAIGSLYPAWRASRTRPVEALKNE